jgi:hypothetical protein
MLFPVRVVASIVLLASPIRAQVTPPELKPPAGERLFLTVHATGDQVYSCKEGVTEFAWVLKAPDAQLFDKDNKPFGKHLAGPSWEASDGSRVTGKPVADAPSPDPDSIPWLLLKVVSHDGNGVLSRVASIQRIHTNGGKAPVSGCDSVHAGQEVRVSYTADYLFYTAK